MKNYFENLNETIKEYFLILSNNDIPEFLNEYINTKVMQKQAGISVSCGTIYSKMFDIKLWYSSLDHSVAVALIIWNFTKDKKQTLSGLFHDIATPVFKHCIDFMNGDRSKQETTEDETIEIIQNSKEIMDLLNRDGIKIEEVSDYKIYSIADNETPKLSADRLEYTLSNGLGVRKKLWNIEEVREVYNNIEIQKNENGIIELGFKNKDIAEKFVSTMRKLSNSYIDNATKLSMQFLADVMKKMSQMNLITKQDLYILSEQEVIEKIENCENKNISECFKIWKNATKVEESEEPVEGKYCTCIHDAKIRYINPLVKTESGYQRINLVSENAKEDIQKVLNYKTRKYAYIDCNLEEI